MDRLVIGSYSRKGNVMNRVFEKVKIRNMELKNRLMMSAMLTDYATRKGEVTDRLIAYHRERAAGGVGLIETEAAYVHPSGIGHHSQLGICEDALIPGLRRLAKAVHDHGAKIAVQLHHAGRRTSKAVTGYEVLAPSAIACFAGETPPDGMFSKDLLQGLQIKEMTPEEIAAAVDWFAQAARRAKEAGFDAVSIHAAHGYLVASFLSPFTNKRRDAYGGDQRGRLRFLTEIIEKVREEVGDLPILVKISGEEFVSGGLSPADTQEIAPWIEKAGADAITVSAGTVGELKQVYPIEKPLVSFLRSLPMSIPRGCYVPLAEGIKKRVRIPVIAVGRINSPSLIEEIVEKEQADFVALGRALLADPYLPSKMEKGLQEEVRTCIACNQGCFEILWDHQAPITCAINPMVGREMEWRLDRAANPKRIAIIGGGPSGMEAARLLSLRGHDVSLIEAKDQLGGLLHLARIAPHRDEIGEYINFLIRQLKHLPVKVLTNTKATLALLQDIHPEIVILATGARPLIPRFVGQTREGVLTAEELLSGKKDVGKEVIIAGGGFVGCEIAERLSELGKKVIIVEMLKEILKGEFTDTVKYFKNVIAKYNIRVYTESEIKQITPGNLVFQTSRGEAVSLQADTIVLALGYVSNSDLKKEINSSVFLRVFEIGDCVKPRKILDAVSDAYQLALSI
jgi:2,4-dienoyl-CoA reductase-like NADH-dependent reductase (Old Yellow Enzyme family)/thioredoxin reductase